MPKTVPVEVRIADAPKMQEFIGSVAGLIKALAKCEDLPEPVMAAADRVRLAVVALGGEDIGPVPPGTDEERLRAAMKLARENPGRAVTVNLDD